MAVRLHDIIEATGAARHGSAGDVTCIGFAYDSRADCRDRLFVAIRTESGDGHDYTEDAVGKGAAAVICERLPAGRLGVPHLLVPDVLVALADWGRRVMRRWAPLTVAVTGSLGKSTTKELLATLLGQRYRVSATPGNLSGRLGLPIALGEMDTAAEVAVLEFAGGSFGEIQAMANVAPPDVVVVTNVCEPHIGVFGSLDNTAAEIAQALDRLGAGGRAVLNADDERVWAMRERAPRVLSYGLRRGDVRASGVAADADGLSFTVHAAGADYACRTPLRAPAHVHDCLAAVTAAVALGVEPRQAVAALERCRPLPGRLNPVPGRGGALILDDTFSGCPTSALAALAGLEPYAGRRRHLVLGGLDDGEGVPGWEQALASACPAEAVWALGDQAAEVARRLPSGRQARIFYSLPELQAQLLEELGEGDVVLVKGNRAGRLERLVAGLALPEGREALVRQEPHWQAVRLARPERPTWVEIDAEALSANVRLLRRRCGVPVMAVLKADAYGHGAVRAARIALGSGADAIGVACLGEARVLRQAGIAAPILVLGYTPPWQSREAVRAEAACTVFGREEAEALSRAALALGRRAMVHVKVDTGMARLGLAPEESPEFMRDLARLPGLGVEGVFTHFGSADDADKSYALAQLGRFLGLLRALEAEGLRPPLAHAANTAAALTMPEARLDMVRLGIGLFGLQPSPAVALPEGCRPVLSFKTTVAQVKTVARGTFVGYGRACRVEAPRTIAVIPVGYADGFPRGPANWGSVLIRGRACPIIGNVCMDQAMIDVSDAPGVAKGDEVVLIGRQGQAGISAEEVAERLGTINYEVVSTILARVPRVT